MAQELPAQCGVRGYHGNHSHFIPEPTEAQAGDGSRLWTRAMSQVCRPHMIYTPLVLTLFPGTGLPLTPSPSFPCGWGLGILPESCLLGCLVLDIDRDGSNLRKWAGGLHSLGTGVKGLHVCIVAGNGFPCCQVPRDNGTVS